MAITAHRHSRSGIAAAGTELTHSHHRTWREQDSDTGAASFALQNTDAQINLCRYGDIVKLRDPVTGGRFAMLYEKRRKATVDDFEEWGQATVFEGRGHLAVLEEGLVLPEWLGREGEPATDSRTFNFSSRAYPDTSWPFAIVSNDDRFGTPNDWFDVRDGSWIWDRTVNGAFTAPIGSVFFRKGYTVATTAKRARVYLAADDLYELWFDNELLLTEDDWYHAQSQNVEIELPVGSHVFAVKGHNVNVAKAGIKFAMYELDSANEPGTLLLESDATWKALGYPSPEPGYTPGGILKRCLFEMGDTTTVGTHKSLTDVTLGFDEFNDSDGAAWPTVTDFAVRIGTSILDVARQLAETYIDVAMDPDTLRLEAWVKGTRGGASGVELYAGQGGSLTSLTHEGQG